MSFFTHHQRNILAFLFAIVIGGVLFPSNAYAIDYWAAVKSQAKKAVSSCEVPTAQGDAVPIKPTREQQEAAKRYVQKEIGNCNQITFAGQNKQINFGSWDFLLSKVGKIAIRSLTKELVNWVGGGTNSDPKFVTDPEQFFTDIANETAIEYTQGADLNALPSTFQQNVRTSLANNFNKTRGNTAPAPVPITGLKGSLDDFYNNFENGGWDTWFLVSQVDTNNPYTAYLQAEEELERRIETNLGIEEQLLDWGNGFLSQRPCLRYSVPGTTASGVRTGEPVCLEEGKIQTPGVLIEDYLAETSGTWIRQLELADELDEVINAALGNLSNRFLKDGLSGFKFNEAYNDAGGDEVDEVAPTQPDATTSSTAVACAPNVTRATLNEVVVWTATIPANQTVSWSGEGMTSNDNPQLVTYTTSGTKNASISTVTNGIPQTVQCASVYVSNFPALSVSCSPAVRTGNKDEKITWKAIVSGGSNGFMQVTWADNATTPENNWSSNRAFLIDGLYTYEADNTYETDGIKATTISVVDDDNTVEPITSQACTQTVLIGNRGNLNDQ